MKNCWIIGLVIVVFASFANGLLIRSDIGGLSREAMRLFILIGISLFVFGIIKVIKNNRTGSGGEG